MKDIQGNVFSDFEVPKTSDGSYRGRKNIVDKTKEHMMKKFDQELAEVNARLKSCKTKVSLTSLRGGIQLRATLPLKPSDPPVNGKLKKQYTLSLGIPSNFDGLQTAEEEAYELGKLIARKTFTWTDKYLGIQANKAARTTFNDFYEQFEKLYFKSRKRTIRSENSFHSYKNAYASHFLGDEEITPESIKNKILKIKSPSSRKSLIIISKMIGEELGIDFDLSKLKLKVESKKRMIPTDFEVVTNISKFEERSKASKKTKKEFANSWRMHKLIYALMAIYGLRPREIINKPDLDWICAVENTDGTFKVHESNKTGYREVFPFVPEWIELFDIKDELALETLKQYLFEIRSCQAINSKVQNISLAFRKHDIFFKPYDLRHACAIRAHLQGVPIKAAADNLGHTVEMHTEVYQKWFGLENRKKAFKAAFSEQDELDIIKDENAALRKRVAELELKISRLELLKRLK